MTCMTGRGACAEGGAEGLRQALKGAVPELLLTAPLTADSLYLVWVKEGGKAPKLPSEGRDAWGAEKLL